MDELSKLERLKLANQYLILEKLDPDGAEHYSKMRIAFEEGYPDWYEEALNHISDGLSVAECKTANDILNMFRMLKNAYSQLSDKSGVDEKKIAFRGFDGNNEHSYLSYADYTINIQGRFVELQSVNSHYPVLEGYQRMLEEWRKSSDMYNMSKADLIRITEASIHPSMR